MSKCVHTCTCTYQETTTVEIHLLLFVQFGSEVEQAGDEEFVPEEMIVKGMNTKRGV